jgi:ferritin-like metal-binding protein YciE
MDNVNHLRDLLRFDLKNLQSAEDQIAEALPAMIEKVSHPDLKEALEQHLLVTRRQRERVEALVNRIGEGQESEGLFGSLFGTGVTNKGIEGLVDEGEKLMRADMAPEVMDAAIIGACQKIEHYEIAAYGTARTYAEGLGMQDVAEDLQRILDEEYEANDLLTELAEGGINRRAEMGEIRRNI